MAVQPGTCTVRSHPHRFCRKPFPFSFLYGVASKASYIPLDPCLSFFLLFLLNSCCVTPELCDISISAHQSRQVLSSRVGLHLHALLHHCAVTRGYLRPLWLLIISAHLLSTPCRFISAISLSRIRPAVFPLDRSLSCHCRCALRCAT